LPTQPEQLLSKNSNNFKTKQATLIQGVACFINCFISKCPIFEVGIIHNFWYRYITWRIQLLLQASLAASIFHHLQQSLAALPFTIALHLKALFHDSASPVNLADATDVFYKLNYCCPIKN
jgi:hypothetical protein